MVKGISKQVIVVHAPDPKLFEQAIFILKEGAVSQQGMTEEKLLKEAKDLLVTSAPDKRRFRCQDLLWALGGGSTVGAIWLISLFL